MAGMVIVGGGQAAASAAAQLRRSEYDGDVMIVASEDHLPYQRPPLSKGYLQETEGLDAVFMHPDEWYSENNVEVRTGTTAVGLDASEHRVELAGGETVGYEKLLIATGSTARRLELPGADLLGVHTLRTIEDSKLLHARLRPGGQRVVIVGAGWIGLEVAASATVFGNSVTVIGRGDVPLKAALGAELGGAFQALHESHGVEFRLNSEIDSFTGSDIIEGVVVDGEEVPADLVVVGVGATPNTALAEAGGLEVDDGILVDASLRTSATDVYAAGDIASIDHPVAGRRLRTEHWDTARLTGKAAARAMLGEEVSYSSIPYFYTDQYDLGMELSGWPHRMADARVVFRGDRASGKYIAFWLDDSDHVVAGMNVNVWKVNADVKRLISSGVGVDPARLVDEEVPLANLTA